MNVYSNVQYIHMGATHFACKVTCKEFLREHRGKIWISRYTYKFSFLPYEWKLRHLHNQQTSHGGNNCMITEEGFLLLTEDGLKMPSRSTQIICYSGKNEYTQQEQILY